MIVILGKLDNLNKESLLIIRPFRMVYISARAIAISDPRK